MRNISFFLTTPQFIDGSKDVTRRAGWEKLREGEYLQAVKKAQGLKSGERIERLGVIEVVSVRWELLRRMIDLPEYGREEVIREGFPGMGPEGFVCFFCSSHKGFTAESLIRRIEFKRV